MKQSYWALAIAAAVLSAVMSLFNGKAPGQEAAPLAKSEKPIAIFGSTHYRMPRNGRLIEFSPDAKYVLVSDGYTVINLWEISTGQFFKSFELHKDGGGANRMGFTPDRTQLVYMGRREHRWDATTWNELTDEAGVVLNNEASRRRFNQIVGAKANAFAKDRNKVIVEDIATGARLITVELAEGELLSNYVLSPANDYLAVVKARKDNSRVEVWNVRRRKKAFEVDQDFQHHMVSVAFSPNEKSFFIADGFTKTIDRYAVVLGTKRATISQDVGFYSMKLSPDGERLVTVNFDGTMNLYDHDLEKPGHALIPSLYGRGPRGSGRLEHVSFSRDGKKLAVAGQRAIFHVFDLETRQEIHPHSGMSGTIGHVEFSPDGQVISATDQLGRTVLLNAGMMTQIEVLESDEPGWATSFTPDGKHLLRRQQRYRPFQVIDRESKKVLHEINDGVYQMMPGGKTLVAAAGESLRFFDFKSGKQIEQLPLAEKSRSFAVTPDGKYIGVCSKNRNLNTSYELWDVHRARRITKRPARRGQGGHSLTASPTEMMFASRNGNTVDLWRVPDGETESLPTSGMVLSSFKFSPDGTLLALAGTASGPGWKDWRIEIWEVHSRKRCMETARRDSIMTYAFAPDGKSIVVGYRDGAIATWDLRPDDTPRVLRRWSDDHFEKLWGDLSSDDAPRAYRAVWLLADGGDQAVDLMAEKLKPARDDKLNMAMIRAIRTLRQIGTDKAQALLKTLAMSNGANPSARLADAARAYVAGEQLYAKPFTTKGTEIDASGFATKIGFDEKVFGSRHQVDFKTKGKPATEVVERIAKQLRLKIEWSGMRPKFSAGVADEFQGRTWLEALERVCAQFDSHPAFLKLTNTRKEQPGAHVVTLTPGKREQPIGFSGPFLVEVVEVNDRAPLTTGTVQLAVRGFNLSEHLHYSLSAWRYYAFKIDAIQRADVDHNDQGSAKWPAVIGDGSFQQVKFAAVKNLLRDVTELPSIETHIEVDVPRTIQSLTFETPQAGMVRRAGDTVAMIESIEKQPEGQFYFDFALQFEKDNRDRYFAFDKYGKPLKLVGRGGGSSSTSSFMKFSVDQRPAKIVVTLGDKQPFRVDIPVKNIPLRMAKLQPTKIRQPQFDGEEPVQLSFFKQERNSDPRRPEPPSSTVKIENRADMGIRQVTAKIFGKSQPKDQPPFEFKSRQVYASLATGERQVAIQPRQTVSQEGYYGAGEPREVIITAVEFENGYVWRRAE